MLRIIVSTAIRQLACTQSFTRLAAKPTSGVSSLASKFSTFFQTGFHPTLNPRSLRFGSVPANPVTLNVATVGGPICLQQPCRTVTKFSMRKGKRKTVKAVIKRFKRLEWGGWIRTRAGRHKHMWKKSAARKRRLRQHVLVNSQQATLLDKMVTKYWKRPRHYINDPYTPYHTREELRETRRKPLRY
ncbi:39S ribosomal protein L35, mitochondrial [Wyeomyia smithii]|uniref:39S ribosomal protein L35, mitochondrial n=1 Tax=Wyeomyia smithii TaxID=174621 RepID=UPI002468200A|nr:39S ribosomal protein L35, mitochondrial [Wyeomyia smithii]